MLDEVFRCLLVAHSFKNNVYSFATREFSGWHEISIRRHNNDLVDLSLERQRSNVESQTHVDSLLLGFDFEILVRWVEIRRVIYQTLRSRFI